MKLITFLVTILLALPAYAADKVAEIPIHNITITPGEPWSMVVKFRFKVTAPIEKPNNHYLAYVGNGSPLSDALVARMYIEASTVDAMAVLLSLTAVQTAVVAGTNNKWSLVFIPDLGPAMLIARGEVEVKL